MSEWRRWVLIGGLLAGGLAWGLLSSRKRRKRHVLANAPLTNEDYLRQVGATDDEAEFYLAIRDMFAEQAGVPAKTIHPSQRIADVMSLGFDGILLIEVLLPVARRRGVALTSKAIDNALKSEWKGRDIKEMTFGDCTGCIVRHWDEIIEASKK